MLLCMRTWANQISVCMKLRGNLALGEIISLRIRTHRFVKFDSRRRYFVRFEHYVLDYNSAPCVKRNMRSSDPLYKDKEISDECFRSIMESASAAHLVTE